MERIITYLYPDENKASSLKIFQERTNQIKAFYFTKDNINLVENMDSSGNYAVYFLFDDSDPDAGRVYVGQSMSGVGRVSAHVRNKDFWTYCILFVTDNNSFDKLSIDYIEYEFISRFKKSSYIITNKDLRVNEPNISIYDKPNLEAHIRQIEFLLSAEGVDIRPKEEESAEEEYYYPASPKYQAKLLVRDGKFILKKGSQIKRPIESSKNWKSDRFYRKQTAIIDSYITDGKVKEIDGKFELTLDIAFSSPSAPANLITGRSANGWRFFKHLSKIRSSDGN